MKKYLFFIILYILFTSVLFSNEFDGGTGTSDDPYQIFDIEQLIIAFKNPVGNFYILINDIDLSETRYWNVGDHDGDPNTPDEPRGWLPRANFPRLNGNGFVIKNLYINHPAQMFVALYDYTHGGYFKNLGIVDCDITGGYMTSVFCANLIGGELKNCYATGKVKSISGSAGGFVGIFTYAKIIDCYSQCDVTAKDSASAFLVEYNFSEGHYIQDSYATGKVVGKYSLQPFGKLNRVQNCFWDFETTGVSDFIPDDGALGLTTEEMMKQSTYMSSFENKIFNFSNTWCIDEGNDYPKLRVFGDCPTTGVRENDISIDIYPNPTTDVVKISSNEFIDRIKIINMLGNAVKEIKPERFSKEFDISVGDLPDGVYFLILLTDKGFMSNKIIVHKGIY